MNQIELKEAAERLTQLDRLIVRAFVEWNQAALIPLVEEFSSLKRQIQTYLIVHPAAQLPGEASMGARSVLHKISAATPLPVEQAILGQLMDCNLDAQELEEIGYAELYSWFSHTEYAEGLFKAGALVINAGSLPGTLKEILGETRQCFAFQQYIAVFALCRAMLDVSVKDIAVRLGVLPADTPDIVQISARRHESLNSLINAITHRGSLASLRGLLHEIRAVTNPVVHGARVADEKGAARVLRETLRAIHLLYEAMEDRER